MAYATRCPHCNTAFRVASDQLKLRGGIVRCGACNEVFDGNATLVDLDAVAAQAPEAPASDAFDAEIAGLEAEPAASSEAVYTLEFDTAFDPFGILPTPAPSEPQAGEPEPDADADTEADADADIAAETSADTASFPLDTPSFPLDTPSFPLDTPSLPLDTPSFPRKREPNSSDASTDTASFPSDTPSFPSDTPSLPPDTPSLPSDTPSLPLDTPSLPLDTPSLPLNTPSFPRKREPNSSDASDTAEITESATESPGATLEQDLSAALEPDPLQPEPLPQRASAASEQARAPKDPAPEPDPELDEPEFVRRSRRQEKASRNRRILMSIGSLLLLATLLVQGVTTFRNVLAAQFPQLTPALASACELLGCRVELPSQIEALSVETGELQALGGDTFALTTLLRNQSRLVQAWPSLELALTDANDKQLLRRVFTPAEYLPPAIAPAKGFAAHSEQPVKLHFELKQLKASGYRIAIFYP